MFAVIWQEEALDALADCFVRADLPVREHIERAVTGFNSRLAADPHQVGESRDGRRRIAIDGRCAITFRVNDAARVVRVIHFWTF